ncbi:SdiA-regulated domain-containing protein [Pseudomonas schmalbachii]|uniref:SdiA-regulated domain-containing protein n=1 Tax=Pseudomonas schmalbachii TaxID=2816993 RepID=A0ABS3TYU9_9PSED|nr:SdiA-regulated domain-containing protein [Pseudomonas schmalbachii]MBO3277860.1 SdiA-regulated domain-containing protein [Pseudomonas schmalbachii]
MPRLTFFRLLLIVLLIVLAALAWLGQQFRVYERGWFAVREWRHAESWRERSIWLPDYRVVIEGKEIEGLDDDVSALTYDPDRHSLFSVTNQPAQIIELSLDGRLLRKIPLTGFGDPEAIEYIGPGSYVISDEREQRLIRVHVDDLTSFIDAADGEQLSLGIGLSGNKGFEGLAFDAAERRLFVAKERDPVRIYEIRGFPHTQADKPFAVHVLDDPKRDRRLFVRDLSSLQYDERSGHLLALSDESRLVVELDVDGKPISTLSLLGGMQGLERSVPQAEGVAMDEAGALYLVSEPNLFYVFRKPELQK